MSSLPPPPNTRPYRRASEPCGDAMRTFTDTTVQRWRQIGWHGQSGAFYALDERPADHEPGSFAPLWLLADNDPRLIDDAPAATEAETTSRVLSALHRSAEEDVTRVIDLYERWTKAGPPPIGTSIARWWDARLVELHGAIANTANEPSS
ncbi:hypothetical protein [Streptomyces sp. NPDC088733]|uniref:hypothetical protein n=1 Tax=Streptomyces sp. NPDC088733 TaxID=3365880 RepID=UPI003828E519